MKTLATLLKIPTQDIAAGGFEEKLPVCSDPEARGFKEPPHLDFVFHFKDGSRIGIECKLFEPYGRLDHAALRQAYLDLPDAWNDIPACRTLAEQLSEGPAGYHRLGASQLLKHILGLKYGARTEKTRLIYLYYDAIGDEAGEHREEIRRFQAAVEPDPIHFVPLSVQEFIVRAVRQERGNHQDYVDYLAARYL